MGMARNVEEEAWVTCRANAQLKFLTSLQRELEFEGLTRAPGMLRKCSGTMLTVTLADTGWLMMGRCNDFKRQTLAPLCREECKEMLLTRTVKEGMESQG